jgi:hypothetical protein
MMVPYRHERREKVTAIIHWWSWEKDREEILADAALDAYQRGLEAGYNGGNGRVINISGDSERPFFVEPHDPGDVHPTIAAYLSDTDGPAPVQYLGHGEPDQDQRAFQGTEPERAVAAPMKLVEPPGALVMRLAAYLPGQKRLRKDLEQVVADMRVEHFEALASGDEAEAKLALRRGRLACLHTVFPSWLASIVAVISKFFGLA